MRFEKQWFRAFWKVRFVLRDPDILWVGPLGFRRRTRRPARLWAGARGRGKR
jgi:hypothetical protein